jgi:hypothetical protein
MGKHKGKHKPPEATANLETSMCAEGNKENAEQPKKKFWVGYNPIERMTLVNVVFVALYSVLTAILACIALQQYRALKTDVRPWIKIDVEIAKVPDRSISVPVRAVNSGKTPAKNYDSGFFIEVVNNGDDPRLDGAGTRTFAKTGVLFPNTPTDVTVTYTFGESDFQDIKSGKKFFVLYGMATYTDFFRVKHWTKICRFFAGNGLFTAKKCTDYNDIDDN